MDFSISLNNQNTYLCHHNIKHTQMLGCLENEDRRPKTEDLEKEDPLESEDLEKEDPLENKDLEKEDPLESEDLEKEVPLENKDLEKEDPLENEDLENKDPLEKHKTKKCGGIEFGLPSNFQDGRNMAWRFTRFITSTGSLLR